MNLRFQFPLLPCVRVLTRPRLSPHFTFTWLVCSWRKQDHYLLLLCNLLCFLNISPVQPAFLIACTGKRLGSCLFGAWNTVSGKQKLDPVAWMRQDRPDVVIPLKTGRQQTRKGPFRVLADQLWQYKWQTQNYQFNKYFLNAYFVPGIVDIVWNG